MSSQSSEIQFINRQSFIELDARERAIALLDAGTARELVGPFDRMESPWLAIQGVTPQADDGCVVMKGKIAGQAAVVVALEGAFQGGSMGEVSGEKMTAALDFACADTEKTRPGHLSYGWHGRLFWGYGARGRPRKLCCSDTRSSTRNERPRSDRTG